jgi:hypothetical protein
MITACINSDIPSLKLQSHSPEILPRPTIHLFTIPVDLCGTIYGALHVLPKLLSPSCRHDMRACMNTRDQIPAMYHTAPVPRSREPSCPTCGQPKIPKRPTNSFILPIISVPQEVETSEHLCFQALLRITSIKPHPVPPISFATYVSTPHYHTILHTHLPEPALQPHPTIRPKGSGYMCLFLSPLQYPAHCGISTSACVIILRNSCTCIYLGGARTYLPSPGNSTCFI